MTNAVGGAATQSFLGRHRIALAAGLLALVQIGLFWPGIVEPDALAVYTHAKTNIFDDWHPPILGRLWQVFLALGLEGTAPFFVIQTGLFWLGLGLIASALDRIGHVRAAIGILLLGCLPHVLGWNTLVLKDTQMTCCLLASAGLYIGQKLQGRPIGLARAVAIAVLLCYAILVRHNAIFAVAPLIAGFAFEPGRGWRQPRALALVTAALGLFAMMNTINRDVFHAEHAHAENSLKLFDLAGTAHFGGLPTIPGISRADWARAEARQCYNANLWDTYNTPEDESGCPWIYHALAKADLTEAWISTIVHNFPAYLNHRAHHFNATMRFFSSRYNWDAASPRESDNPNPYGIGKANKRVLSELADLQMAFDYTPFGRPFAWYGLALMLVAYAWRLPAAPQRQVALILLGSVLISGSSFFVVGVANEFRYHHWAIVAVGCAACLIFSIEAQRRWRTALAMAVPICVVFAVVFVGFMIRDYEWAPIAASSWIDPPSE